MLMFRSWSSNEITGLFKHPRLSFHNFYEADSYWAFNLDLVCLELIAATPHGPPPPDLIIVITTLLPRPCQPHRPLPTESIFSWNMFPHLRSEEGCWWWNWISTHHNHHQAIPWHSALPLALGTGDGPWADSKLTVIEGIIWEIIWAILEPNQMYCYSCHLLFKV